MSLHTSVPLMGPMRPGWTSLTLTVVNMNLKHAHDVYKPSLFLLGPASFQSPVYEGQVMQNVIHCAAVVVTSETFYVLLIHVCTF